MEMSELILVYIFKRGGKRVQIIAELGFVNEGQGTLMDAAGQKLTVSQLKLIVSNF